MKFMIFLVHFFMKLSVVNYDENLNTIRASFVLRLEPSKKHVCAMRSTSNN